MKLNKDDLYNLGCLKLAQMEVWTSQRCLDSIKWGKRQRHRSQDRYLAKMLKMLVKIDVEQPGLLEGMFKTNINSIIQKGETNGSELNAITESIVNEEIK